MRVAEIAQLHDTLALTQTYIQIQHVFQLDISVYNVAAVQVFDRVDELP